MKKAQMHTMPESKNRFMQAGDVRRERDPWATVEWLCREDLVEAEQLLLVRATIAAVATISLSFSRGVRYMGGLLQMFKGLHTRVFRGVSLID